MTNEHLSNRDKLVLCAGTAAANILQQRGLSQEDIANGLMSFAGAMMIELVGADEAADVFQSKADALRENIQ